MANLVWGRGFNDVEGPLRTGGVVDHAYQAWWSILRRCYDKKYLIREPTYIGCSVCDEWLSFYNFKQWYGENYREGFQLDKDIIIPGNKVYSSETCRYVPQYLNTLLTDNAASRGELPLGVTAQKPRQQSTRKTTTYQARCKNGHGKNISKTFKTVEEAHNWYSITKKRIVKEQAIRAFLDNAIKTDVYLALVRREF